MATRHAAGYTLVAVCLLGVLLIVAALASAGFGHHDLLGLGVLLGGMLLASSLIGGFACLVGSLAAEMRTMDTESRRLRFNNAIRTATLADSPTHETRPIVSEPPCGRPLYHLAIVSLAVAFAWWWHVRSMPLRKPATARDTTARQIEVLPERSTAKQARPLRQMPGHRPTFTYGVHR